MKKTIQIIKQLRASLLSPNAPVYRLTLVLRFLHAFSTSKKGRNTVVIDTNGEVYVRLSDGIKLLFNIDMNLGEIGDGQNLIYLEQSEKELMVREIVLQIMDDIDCYVDVGANNGYSFVIPAIQKGVQRVVAFEPNPLFHHHLKRNIELNCGQFDIRLSDKALSNFEGKSSFAGFKGASAHLESKQRKRFRRKSSMVSVTTLDKELIQVGCKESMLIKIDVEGYEIEVLQGATKTISKWEPIFLVEINSNYLSRRDGDIEDFNKFFSKHSYRLIRLFDSNDFLAFSKNNHRVIEFLKRKRLIEEEYKLDSSMSNIEG